MSDPACTEFLQWALPCLGLRWAGFRKVRGQVCKRIKRRMAALGVDGFAAYRQRLEADPQEWGALDQCCHVTISKFFRNGHVFDGLRVKVLPAIAACAQRQGRHARCWSAGCACGEEPYTLKILWDLDVRRAFPDVALSVVATDIDENVLARARAGCYRATRLRPLPSRFIAEGFEPAGPLLGVRPGHRAGVTFVCQDVRSQAPPGPFDIIFCRNLAFTYFAEALQQRVVETMAERLLPNGYVVVGAHEWVQDRRFVPVDGVPHVFVKDEPS